MVWGALIGAGVSLLGGALASKGAGKASDAAVTGQMEAVRSQERMFEQIREDQAPWREAGSEALRAAMSMTGLPLAPRSGGGGTQPLYYVNGNTVIGGNQRRDFSYAEPFDPRNVRGTTYTGEEYYDNVWDLPEGNQFRTSYPTGFNVGGGPMHYAGSPSELPRASPREAGGPVNPGNSYMVGETGPETLQTPSGSQTVGLYGTEVIQPSDSGYIVPQQNPGGQEGEYNFMTDPGYQFRFNEGVRARDASAASRGQLYGTGHMRRMTRYGQGIASEEYGNVYNRIASIAQIGQTANNATANAGLATAQGVAQSQAAAGDARASGYANQANIQANTLNQLSSLDWDSLFE